MTTGRVLNFLKLAALVIFTMTGITFAEDLPDRGEKEADMSKPVKVFILMGQSNMLGFGKTDQLKSVAPQQYPYLLDDAGNWNVRKDVRNVFFCMAQLRYNDWLTGQNGNGSGKIGPEIGIGYHLGQFYDEPVMILKSCVGNRALGWDLLPPSAVGTGAGGKSYQGNSESSNRKVKEPRDGWYAGLQYDQDVGAAQNALKNLSTYYPGAKGYEVAGFFWWQGNAEKGKGNVDTYDKNLAFLFNDLKKDFNAPNAKFVCATLGEHDKNATLSQKMYAFADSPEFKGQAAVFYTKPVSKGGGSGGHYSGNAETYMNVGIGMGKAMVELLKEGGAAPTKAKAEPKKKKPSKPTRAERVFNDDDSSTTRDPKKMTTKADQEIESMLNYLKMMQPTVVVGEKKYPGSKMYAHLRKEFAKNQDDIRSAEKFLDELATKSKSDKPYFVIKPDGSKVMLKVWLRDYLKKLRMTR